MNIKHFALLLLVLLAISCREKKQESKVEETSPDILYQELTSGSIEAISDKMWSLVPRNASIEILAEGHDWTEGPLWVADEKMLLYTDIPRNAIYSWKEGENAKLYLKPSGFLGTNFEGGEPGANGLLLNKQGSLILCQHGERRVAKMNGNLNEPVADYTALASNYNGKRFNSPNDAVFNSTGALYFTDPPYGLPGRMEDPGKELDFQGVYKLDTDGNVILLHKDLTRPNGIAFSPDQKKLYVANSDPELAIWKEFNVMDDGTLDEGTLFYDATELVPTEKGLPDGLKVDNTGNIFATGPGGVLIFSSEGTHLGTIKTGQATSNCAFNEDKSVLFITADSYLLRVKLKD